MLNRIPLIIACGLVSSALLAQDGYLGVYALPRHTTSVGGEVVGFAPRDELHFEVSLANEEGGEELFLPEGLAGGLGLELLRDGEPIPAPSLRLVWEDRERRYAFYGGLPPEPDVAGVLEPGVGLATDLRVRRRSGAGFAPGHYVARLRVLPGAARRSNAEPWRGRGGVGGTSFTLRAAETEADQLLERKLAASGAFAAGDYELAAALWSEIVEADATETSGWAGLGAALHHLGRHALATECLEKAMPAIVTEGHHSGLPFLLATSYVALGEPEKAEETLRAVVGQSLVESAIARLRLKVEVQ